jgi:hypothetical protein
MAVLRSLFVVIVLGASAHAGVKKLALPKAQVPAAKWVSKTPQDVPAFHPVALDAKMAVARSGSTLLAWTEAGGIEGPIKLPPNAPWIGIGDGAIYAATEDGKLYRAADIASARARGLVQVAQVKGARDWDAAGSVVIAAAGTVVSVSSDGGKTFRAHDFKQSIKQVIARSDNVVLAVPDNQWPHISRDRGASWTPPPAAYDPAKQPQRCKNNDCYKPEAPTFSRINDRIATYAGQWGSFSGGINADERSLRSYNCFSAELAADGTSWVAIVEERRYRRHDEPEKNNPFALGTATSASEVFELPRAPAGGKDAAIEAKACLDDPIAFFDARRGGVGVGGWGGACNGTACLDQAPVRPSDRVHAMFSDAKCTKTGCDRTATRMSLGDKGEVVLSRAPCAQGQLTSREGAAVLVCREAPNRAAIHLGDRRGSWHAQGTLDVGDGRVEVAPDGTLLISERCAGAGCRAFVRAPAAFDAAPSWREVTHAGAIGYRVATGGRAIAVAAPSQRNARLVVDMRGYASKPVFGGMLYDAWSDSFGKHPLEGIVAGCLKDAADRSPIKGVLDVTVELGSAPVVRTVTVNNAPDAASKACIETALRGFTYRKPPAAVASTRWIGFAAIETHFSLWLLGPAAPKQLADQLDGSKGLRDVEVVGDHIELAIERTRHVLGADGTLITLNPK